MAVQLEPWQVIGLLLSFFGCMAGFGKLLLAQFDRRLDERFAAQEKSRMESQAHWDTRFSALDRASREEAQQWQRVEREVLALKADLPLRYVLRDDYIRNQTVIEAKIDGVALRIENLSLKGAKND